MSGTCPFQKPVIKTNFKSFLWAVCHLPGGAVCAMAALLLLATTINIQAQYKYTTLSVPGAIAETTSAFGIFGNDIVGNYENSSGIFQGFLYNGSSYSTLSVPGAESTFVRGISGNGIVGYYYKWQNGVLIGPYGFLYNGSSYTTLSVPGATGTYAYGISGNNIVGFYNNGITIQGFLYNGTNYTTLSAPGAEWTYAYGISGNDIVGWYETSSYQVYAFLYNGSSYTTLSVPGAPAGSTYAFGISGNDIVGDYANSSGTYGFLYNGSSYATLKVPGAYYTEAFGIFGNDLVGNYGPSSGPEYAFLAMPGVQPQPHITGIALSGTNLILSGTNSMAGVQYILLSNTNVASPLNQWVPLLTNNFDSNGNFICTNPISANAPKNFYLLQLP